MHLLQALVLVLAAFTAGGCVAQVKPREMRSTSPTPPTAEEMAQLWQEPEDIASRDLFLGPGGAEWQPADGARFAFVEKDNTGYSWGWDLRDERGVEWSAKYGPEARSEVAVSRIVWAVGYHQLPTYYVERWEMTGSSDPVQPSRFRPLPPGFRKVGSFEMHRNPFVGTTPFNGLLTLMRIVNNWDLLDRNTAVYDFDAPRDGVMRWYVIQDLGASLGRTRVLPDSGSRNNVDDFEQQGYVREVKDGRVVFDDLGRTSRGLFEEIPPADVAWISERLDRLTDKQWDDAFRAAGYEPSVAARFIRKIRANVAAGRALAR